MSRSPDQSAASLYCPEDAGDFVSSVANCWISDPPPDDSLIARLIESEPHFMPRPDYIRSIDPTARQDSINWILKVHAFYGFRPVTAHLSVNYFDRVLSSHSLPEGKGWPLQLLSVACLSVAAKMEEIYAPLPVDLQILEPRFVFESKTVQRMELWVLDRLDWRIRSVTPFDYLHYFVSKLSPSGSKPELLLRVMTASSDLIFNTLRVIDFLGFPQSAIAAAAVLSATGESADLPVAFFERVNNEMVRSCHQLMEVYLVDTCHLNVCKDQISEPEPRSPIGVLEIGGCGSCDTPSGIPDPGSGSGSRSASQVEPPMNKRPRSSASNV